MPKKQQKKKMRKLVNAMSECQVSTPPESSSADIVLADCPIPDLKGWPKLKEKVPNIFLHKPADFAQHVRKLLSLGITFYKPYISTYYTKICCVTFDDHKAMVQYFETKQLPYHTYGLPSKRKMKVVIRGLPVDIDLNKLKDTIKSVSIPVIRIHKMYRNENIRDKTCLLLAVVPYNTEGKKLLQVQNILGHDIKLEPPINKVKQCHRCQLWGHTQRFCHGQLKCVKCAGEHLSKKCTRDPNTEPPKCANCGGEHTANYKECPSCPSSLVHTKSQLIKHVISRNAKHEKCEVVTLENVDRLYKNIFYKEKSIVLVL